MSEKQVRNTYEISKPLHDLEGWIIFYGQQAQRLENDPAMGEVFQASCETSELLLELKTLRATSTPEAAGRSDEDRWIPCTERLPKQETPVLIVLRGCVRIGERRWERPTHEESFRAFWYWDDPENDGQDWNTLDVTSWRPLPAPPSGEQAAVSETKD